MIDVSEKKVVPRKAVAEGSIVLKKGTIEAIHEGTVVKGNVLTAAKLAGIKGVKDTSNLIPLCHPIPVTHASVDLDVKEDRIVCRCEVRADYKTGVEMEALVGASIALLTIWDMVKYLEKDERGQYPHTAITNMRVVTKEKGE
ncbi:MAG: cyclic pyranopterin monophosphate synthase MoaC [Methanomassiliicoccales archaeon]|nr:MAG: cyclic pyranopterin monophosphate synthase MoaC [Methanomassiliicoccales archaeon]